MSIRVDEFLEVMERLAPTELAVSWDNVGLQTGSRLDETDAVLVALNINTEVLDEAVARHCGIILSHHPLIFQPLLSVSSDSEAGRQVQKAIREKIAVVAAHTNLDSVSGGLADTLARLMELQNISPLQASAGSRSKLVVYLPAADLERVRQSLYDAGAGIIGNYQHCSYISEGAGSFMPLPGAEPSIGEVGGEESVAELRLEMVFPTGDTDDIVKALINAHSYEEPAYDIYPLENRRRDAGSGRVGELSGEFRLADLASRLAGQFNMRGTRFVGDPDARIRRVALVPGSGASYLNAAASQADVLITGDFSYHQTIQARDLGLSLINIPHHISEGAALANWLPRLMRELEPRGVKVALSSAATGFWQAAPSKNIPVVSNLEEKPMHNLHVDGGARGNPGPAGIGAVLSGPDGETVDTLASYIGEATNNVAEYQAMISGLELAISRGITRLAIFSDSQLIVRQLEGAYRVKNEGLRPYYMQAKSLLDGLEEYELNSIPREANAHADELVNQALDEAGH